MTGPLGHLGRYPSAMKNVLILILILCFSGCSPSPSTTDSTNENSRSKPSNMAEVAGSDVNQSVNGDDTLKGSASPDGLNVAKQDVSNFKARIVDLTAEELIAAFIPRAEKPRYGGYDYYYGFMLNMAIQSEIRSRGNEIVDTLKSNADNKTQIAEATNGPGLTIGQICQIELDRRSQSESN